MLNVTMHYYEIIHNNKTLSSAKNVKENLELSQILTQRTSNYT